jgi:hypothetical protein
MSIEFILILLIFFTQQFSKLFTIFLAKYKEQPILMKTGKTIILFISFSCIFHFTSLKAQLISQVKVEPEPFVIGPPHFDQLTNSPIKQVTTITKLDNYRQLQNDTTSIYRYDKEGKRLTSIRYEKGRLSSTYSFIYTDKKVTESWETFSKPNSSRFYGLTLYDKKGRKIRDLSFYINKKDTTSKTIRDFDYDENGNLLKITGKNEGRTAYVDSYVYESNLLKEHRFYMNPEHFNNYTKADYFYNEDNTLKEKKEYQLIDTAVYLLSDHFYTYSGKNLVAEQYSSAGRTETRVTYTYDNKNKLVELESRRDSLYKKVLYTYEDGRVSKISVESNAWNGLHREFYIPLSSITSLTKTPFFYEEQWSYDSHGNVTEKKYLLNGAIEKIILFSIEYY